MVLTRRDEKKVKSWQFVFLSSSGIVAHRFRDNALSFEPFWIPEGCPHMIRTGAPGKEKNWGFSILRISRPPS